MNAATPGLAAPVVYAGSLAALQLLFYHRNFMATKQTQSKPKAIRNRKGNRKRKRRVREEIFPPGSGRGGVHTPPQS